MTDDIEAALEAERKARLKTLYHPTFGTPLEVDESAVAEWVEQGWLKSKPKAAREADSI
jgi:hypothetical protein